MPVTEPKKLRQYELHDFNDSSRLICWLPIDRRIRVGTRLTLKEIPKRDWIVMRAYKTERTSSDMDFSRKWSVGGLL
jgi:hypothetical protein